MMTQFVRCMIDAAYFCQHVYEETYEQMEPQLGDFKEFCGSNVGLLNPSMYSIQISGRLKLFLRVFTVVW